MKILAFGIFLMFVSAAIGCSGPDGQQAKVNGAIANATNAMNNAAAKVNANAADPAASPTPRYQPADDDRNDLKEFYLTELMQEFPQLNDIKAKVVKNGRTQRWSASIHSLRR